MIHTAQVEALKYIQQEKNKVHPAIQICSFDDPWAIHALMEANLHPEETDSLTKKDLSYLRNFLTFSSVENLKYQLKSRLFQTIFVPHLTVFTEQSIPKFLQTFNSLLLDSGRLVTAFPIDTRYPEYQVSEPKELIPGVVNYNSGWIFRTDIFEEILYKNWFAIDVKVRVVYPQLGRQKDVPGWFLSLRKWTAKERSVVEKPVTRAPAF